MSEGSNTPSVMQINGVLGAYSGLHRVSVHLMNHLKEGSVESSMINIRLFKQYLIQVNTQGAVEQDLYDQILEEINKIKRLTARTEFSSAQDMLEIIWIRLDGILTDQVSRWCRAPRAVGTKRSVVG